MPVPNTTAAANYALFGERRPWRGPVPEICFARQIDNSRLVKTVDPARIREIRVFMAAVCVLFVCVMVYTLQHFSAIEYGYRIQAEKQQKEALLELNRELRLQEASLRDPERIDALAHRMGLASPQASQMQRLDSDNQTSSEPELAAAESITVPTPELGSQ